MQSVIGHVQASLNAGETRDFSQGREAEKKNVRQVKPSGQRRALYGPHLVRIVSDSNSFLTFERSFYVPHL